MIMDPIWFENKRIKTSAPTYKRQIVPLSREMEKRYPGLAE